MLRNTGPDRAFCGLQVLLPAVAEDTLARPAIGAAVTVTLPDGDRRHGAAVRSVVTHPMVSRWSVVPSSTGQCSFTALVANGSVAITGSVPTVAPPRSTLSRRRDGSVAS